MPPNKPKFGMIVALFALAIIVILAAGVVFIHWDGKHLTFGRGGRNIASDLQAPDTSSLRMS